MGGGGGGRGRGRDDTRDYQAEADAQPDYDEYLPYESLDADITDIVEAAEGRGSHLFRDYKREARESERQQRHQRQQEVRKQREALMYRRINTARAIAVAQGDAVAIERHSKKKVVSHIVKDIVEVKYGGDAEAYGAAAQKEIFGRAIPKPGSFETLPPKQKKVKAERGPNLRRLVLPSGVQVDSFVAPQKHKRMNKKVSINDAFVDLTELQKRNSPIFTGEDVVLEQTHDGDQNIEDNFVPLVAQHYGTRKREPKSKKTREFSGDSEVGTATSKQQQNTPFSLGLSDDENEETNTFSTATSKLSLSEDQVKKHTEKTEEFVNPKMIHADADGVMRESSDDEDFADMFDDDDIDEDDDESSGVESNAEEITSPERERELDAIWGISSQDDTTPSKGMRFFNALSTLTTASSSTPSMLLTSSSVSGDYHQQRHIQTQLLQIHATPLFHQIKAHMNLRGTAATTISMNTVSRAPDVIEGCVGVLSIASLVSVIAIMARRSSVQGTLRYSNKARENTRDRGYLSPLAIPGDNIT